MIEVGETLTPTKLHSQIIQKLIKKISILNENFFCDIRNNKLEPLLRENCNDCRTNLELKTFVFVSDPIDCSLIFNLLTCFPIRSPSEM